MSRPSDPLLRWLRQQVDAAGLTVAALATRLDRPRADVRRVLSGAEAMTVDDLLAIGQVLDLDPAALGVPASAEDGLAEAARMPEPDAFRGQAAALFRVGFDLGIDFVFRVAVARLGDWGGPDAMVEAHAEDGEMLLRLDAAYHGHMRPSFDDEAIHLDLSFDVVTRCRIPWHAVTYVAFWPEPPEAPEDEVPPDAGRPHLRLVE